MGNVLKKTEQSAVSDKKNRIPYIKAVVLMSLFTFVFLETEFWFVDILARTVSGDQSVTAQNYALGISVIGFVLYPVVCRFCKGKLQVAILAGAEFLNVACLFLMCHDWSYSLMLCVGLLLFLVLGLFGSAVFYKSMCLLEDNTHVARLAGISYMIGIILQVVNNNLIHTDIFQAVILAAFILIVGVVLVQVEKTYIASPLLKDGLQGENRGNEKASLKICTMLVLFVVLLTCIFSTMDNAVTLYHANGIMNIGQWPRILLALSGLLAGFLFDIAGRKYMSMIMYCVMILSTTCLVILQFSGPFMIGLIIFYLSAGFFAVFFTVSFMEIARYTRIPELWAGFGRAVNNLVAVAITGGSLTLLNSGNNIAIITIELLLFVFASIVALVYTNRRKDFFDELAAKNDSELSDSERLQRLSEQFVLTQRETEVFGLLVNTEEGLQVIADQLCVSRRTLERYVSAIYKKTGAKSRIGLISLYNNI